MTPDSKVFLDLAERVEASDGPDREIDEAIMSLLFVRRNRFLGVRYVGSGKRAMSKVWVDLATGKWVSTHAHEFTASLDAAMTLRPKAWLVEGEYFTAIEEIMDDPSSWVARFDTRGDECGHGDTIISQPCATPALALTAACLRARAAEGAQLALAAEGIETPDSCNVCGCPITPMERIDGEGVCRGCQAAAELEEIEARP